MSCNITGERVGKLVNSRQVPQIDLVNRCLRIGKRCHDVESFLVSGSASVVFYIVRTITRCEYFLMERTTA